MADLEERIRATREGASAMTDIRFPKPTRALAERRRALAPEAEDAFRAFSKAVLSEGALDTRTKQLIAVAVAHVTQCPWCIEGHVKGARREGATAEQIMEAIWVAAEMRAGAAYAHSVKALELLDDTENP
jgi:AhpD family alkylhydroperoxidase